jgi:spore coat protein A
VLPEFFGDHILVNGQAWPVMDVEPTVYRLRMLNGSDSRFYNLRLSSGDSAGQLADPQIQQIGTDSGLLYAPVPLDKLALGPGERADVLVDFSQYADQTLILRNNAHSPFPKGDVVDPRTTGQIMAFRVGGSTSAQHQIPSTLLPSPIDSLVQTGPTRNLLLFEGEDEYGRLQPMLGTVDEGGLMWDDPTTEEPQLNSVEVWEIFNSTEDAHPIHLHLVAFQVLSRQKFKADQDLETGALEDITLLGQPKPPAENEAGWKDTVQMFPGEVTRLIAKFDRPGEYVWHCHILSHEDHEMMRRYVVLDTTTLVGAIPEPSALAMLAIGLAVFGIRMRVEKRCQEPF